MKKLIIPLIGILVFLTSAIYSLNPSDLQIKDNHSIAFISKDPTGKFKVLEGTVQFDENDLENSFFDLTFPVSSISTGNGIKDKKALTSEWFDASKHPNIYYKSSGIKQTSKGYIVAGTLTIRGIAKSKNVPLTVTKTKDGMVFSGTFGVNRLDHKVGKPSEIVPDIMKIEYSIPVAKK